MICFLIGSVYERVNLVSSRSAPAHARGTSPTPMASTRNALVILVVFALTACSAFTLQPKLAVAPQPKALRAAATMQFGGGSPERDGITRDNEPEEFFKTNMDDMTDEEKLKSPVVWGGLLILIAPFLVGAIALQFYR